MDTYYSPRRPSADQLRIARVMFDRMHSDRTDPNGVFFDSVIRGAARRKGHNGRGALAAMAEQALRESDSTGTLPQEACGGAPVTNGLEIKTSLVHILGTAGLTDARVCEIVVSDALGWDEKARPSNILDE